MEVYSIDSGPLSASSGLSTFSNDIPFETAWRIETKLLNEAFTELGEGKFVHKVWVS